MYLIIAATYKEIEPLCKKLGVDNEIPVGTLQISTFMSYEVGILIAGIGIYSSTINIYKTILDNNIEACIQAGICGRYSNNFENGDVVNVVSDCFGDLGSDSPDGFIPAHEIGLNDIPGVVNGKITLEHKIAAKAVERLPKVKGCTIQMTSGTVEGIKRLRLAWQADIESMEGAVFMQLFSMHKIPAIQLRGISNLIEPRNKSGWKIELAIEKLNNKLIELVEEITAK